MWHFHQHANYRSMCLLHPKLRASSSWSGSTIWNTSPSRHRRDRHKRTPSPAPGRTHLACVSKRPEEDPYGLTHYFELAGVSSLVRVSPGSCIPAFDFQLEKNEAIPLPFMSITCTRPHPSLARACALCLCNCWHRCLSAWHSATLPHFREIPVVVVCSSVSLVLVFLCTVNVRIVAHSRSPEVFNKSL